MASFVVNALKVNFESVLSMEDAGMKNQDAPQTGEGSKKSGDKATVEPKKEKVVKKKKIVVLSSAAPAKMRSETSSNDYKRPLVVLGTVKTGGSDKEETEETKPKLVKPKPAVEEKVVSKELPLVVRTESEQSALQSTAYGSGMEDFDVVSELNSVKRVITSLESTVNMMRDDQTYMKYDSQIFRRAFYKKMDEVVTSVNTSQTALETNLIRQFTESQ
ncbi:hypothetical protein F511_10920 [Dorcoceras hygrometricum]|uniref:Uncharacterized protein n=1 Tax=Dorcoceras hygrometricum TaxID=472368 RepID=A0A2Z7CQM8_9LAMI|nr:hypothetical protein F511_10920 [Dorcoceras hygrometricum]